MQEAMAKNIDNAHLKKLTKSSLADAVMCQYDGYPKHSCMDRSCKICRNKFTDLMEPMAKILVEEIVWYHWDLYR